MSFSFKASLPMRILRNRHDNAVWFWQQRRVRRAIHRAFEAQEPLGLSACLELQGGWPDESDERPVVFAACDEGYFYRFACHLALSSASRSPGTRVHLHLYEPSSKCLDDLATLIGKCGGRLTASHEGPRRNPFDRPRSFYFAGGRFAVADRMRTSIAAPILMVDADGLVANDLEEGFQELAGVEAGFILQPDNEALYRKILASAIYLGTDSVVASEFFTRLADGIDLALIDAGRYHVDQIGIHYALEWSRFHREGPAIDDLPIKWSDYRFRRESLIWSTKGARKSLYEKLVASVEQSA